MCVSELMGCVPDQMGFVCVYVSNVMGSPAGLCVVSPISAAAGAPGG